MTIDNSAAFWLRYHRACAFKQDNGARKICCMSAALNGTASSCCSASCAFQPLATPCDDGDACTDSDTCDSAGSCIAGSTLACDDLEICTDDSCNPASGCVFVNNSNACDDDDACTTSDACSGGSCQGGSPLVCDDLEICTDDSCNPSSGCVFTNNSNTCDDGNICTAPDVCSAGSCVSGPPVPCDSDLDGIYDSTDNCTNHANASQNDTDCDGFGNRCDADFNNDGMVDIADLDPFNLAIGGNDPLYDLEEPPNGIVNAVDLVIFQQLFGLPPGPSNALECTTDVPALNPWPQIALIASMIAAGVGLAWRFRQESG